MDVNRHTHEASCADLTRGSIKLHQILDQILGKVDGFPGQPGNDAQLLSHLGYYTSVTPILARTIKLTGT